MRARLLRGNEHTTLTLRPIWRTILLHLLSLSLPTTAAARIFHDQPPSVLPQDFTSTLGRPSRPTSVSRFPGNKRHKVRSAQLYTKSLTDNRLFLFFRRFSDHNNNTHRIVEAPAGSSPRRRITERGWQVIAAFFSVDDDEEDVTTRIRRFDRSIVWWTDGDCWIWPDPTDDLCLRFLSLHCTASTMDPSLQTSQALSLRSSPVVHFLPPFPDKRNGDCLLRRLLLTFPALGFFNEMRRRRRRRGGGSWQTRQDLRVVEKTLSAFRVLLRRAVAASAAPRLRPPPRRPPPPMESNSNEEQMRSSDNADRCSCCAIRSPKQQSPRFTTRQSSQQLLKTEKAKWAPPWK